ncbi:uncharacterized protein LOC143297068 [Babylonia areolata]|uniref:uncharacterized protein LOC143297068 n=1 Tax=Babylonia areolata TaxID=304850 RepID=UPI003FD586BF
MEPDEVTVVVHGARNLQGKKPGRCKFSVIFGVGSRKFRTSVVKEPTGNPDWNEESTVQVQNQGDQVFFTVTEKEDVLGQVQLPLPSLTTTKGQVRQASLKAHRKCPVPHGELIFQAFISKQRPAEVVAPQIRSGSNTTTSGGGPAQLTGFARIRHSLAISPALPRRGPKRGGDKDKDTGSVGDKEEKSKRGSTLSYFNKKLSKSLHDIFHIGRGGGNEDDEEKSSTSNRSKGKFGGSVNEGLDHAGGTGGDVPVVTNIIPNMATVHGGTRLCVEGRHLGLGKSDIMEFMLCGSDLLDSIDFESDSRIYVTTKPNTPGKGDLWIETVSGGQNVIKSVFTFVDRSAEKSGSMERQAPPSSPSVLPPPSPARDAPTPPQPSPSATTRAKSMYVEEDSGSVGDVGGQTAAQRHGNSVQRSSSQSDRSVTSPALKGGAATLPRVKSTPDIEPEEQQELPGRFRKNHQTHARRASESVAMQRGVEARSSASEKAELQKEIVRLMKENEALQKKNDDLNAYIQDLVAKVMENCPEVLAAMPTKK